MIPVTLCETRYPLPDDSDAEYCPDGESETHDDTIGFRELVRALRISYPHPSQSHGPATAHTWASTETEQDYGTDELVERSIHLAHGSHPRYLKYWRAAFRAAGVLRGGA